MRVDLLAALAGTGLTVVEHDGWRTRGSVTFTPRVVVRHATITPRSWSDSKTCRLLIDGYEGLPGPLCQIGLDRRGRVHLIASGRANHAGQGGWDHLSGNSTALGVEAFNDGKEPWPQEQLDAWDVLDAALLAHLDLPAGRLCSHAEWAPTRKTDPRGVNMPAARARVHTLLHPPAPPQEDDMARLISEDGIRQAATDGVRVWPVPNMDIRNALAKSGLYGPLDGAGNPKVWPVPAGTIASMEAAEK